MARKSASSKRSKWARSTIQLASIFQPRLLTADVPHKAHIGIEGFLLPHTCFAIPAIAWLEHDLAKALPGLFQFAVEGTPTGMFLTHAQQIMPAARRAELD